MSSFRFLHAADIHLDSPLHGLSRYEGVPEAEVRGATRRAFDNLVEAALREAVDFVVIAGDLYDGDWRDMGTGLYFTAAMGRLARAGVPVFFLAGNHDAASVLTRSLPLDGTTVKRFGHRSPETHLLEDLGVALHGQSFATAHVSDNLAGGYPAPRAGMFNIGVLHTALEGHPEHASYAPTSVAELAAAGYDYWALGHVHDHLVLHEGPHIVFSGNLQGRNIREAGAKGAVLVEVRDRVVEQVTHLPLDVVRWARVEVDCADASDMDAVHGRVRDALAAAVGAQGDGRPLVARVSLHGATGLHGALQGGSAQLREDVRALAAQVSPDLWIEKLALRTTAPVEAAPVVAGDEFGALLAEAAASPELAAALARDLAEFLAATNPPGGSGDEMLLAAARGGDPIAEARRFETAVTAADDVADRRYLSAEASGQLAALDGRAAVLALQADQARDREFEAATREADALSRWSERLSASRLPDLPPARTRAWLQLRSEALAEAAAAEAAAEAARTAEFQRAAASSEIRAALGEAAGPAGALRPVIARAESRMAAGEAQAAAFRLLKERQKMAEEAAAVLARRIAAVQRTAEEHRSAWSEALTEAGMVLPEEAAEVRLGLIEQLRGAEEAIASLHHRIDAIGGDRARFDAEVAELATALGDPPGDRAAADCVNDLRLRLTRGRSDAQTHAALTQETERHAAAARAAEVAIEAADAQLAPVKALAGAADAAGLVEAVAASRRLRALRDQVVEQERLITAVGELRPLLAACEAEDDEALASRADQLETELSQIGEQLSQAAEKAGAARKALEALDRGPGAAEAASDAQAARAEMEAQAEAYLRTRSQHLILRWAVDRYRERHQNPLLDRAGDLFRTLTLGRYAGLRIDPDSGDRLLALCDDGATLLDVVAMSEGTVDQLYLALRLAAVEQATAAGVRLPFLADDLFINFDDERSRAGFQVLGELARSTQVLFLTHHRHLLPVAEAALGADVVTVCELS